MFYNIVMVTKTGCEWVNVLLLPCRPGERAIKWVAVKGNFCESFIKLKSGQFWFVSGSVSGMMRSMDRQNSRCLAPRFVTDLTDLFLSLLT